MGRISIKFVDEKIIKYFNRVTEVTWNSQAKRGGYNLSKSYRKVTVGTGFIRLRIRFD
jgi:hypothetical protein